MARALLAASAAVLAVLVTSGCGTAGLAEGGETGRGKDLFTASCGSCHVLADAGTSGTIGPNLDDAFVQSRVDGLGETTIRAVVRGQIAYPTENPPTGLPGMPADLVTGEDADAVAAYVASVAGKPGPGGAPAAGGETGEDEAGGEAAPGGGGGAAGSELDGAELFAASGCGSCHVLAVAGATGSIGPNLDESQPSLELAVQRITEGAGAMPAFADRLSEEQIAAVADYVARNAGT